MVTRDEALKELARRELQRRQGSAPESQQSQDLRGELSAMTQKPKSSATVDPRDTILGKTDAAVRGAADMLSFGTADEIAAGLGTGFGYLGDYDKELARQRGIDTADAEQRAPYRIGGQVAGALAGGAGLAKSGLSLTGKAIDAGYRLPAVAGVSALEGAGMGAAQGFGSGEAVADRLEKAGSGAMWGAGTGFVAPFAVAGLSKVASNVLNSRALSNAAKDAPSRADLKATTDQLYQAMRDARITYDSKAWTGAVEKAKDEMLKAGLRPSVAGSAFNYLDDLAANKGLSFDDINGLVQTAGASGRAAERSGDLTTAKAFGIIRDALDEFEMKAPLFSETLVDHGTLNQVRQAARQTALKNIKARVLDDIVTNAETYQSGMDAGIRNQVGNLLRSPKGKQLFNNAERTALLQVSQGRKPIQTLSKFGFDLTSLSGNAALLPTLGAVTAGAGFGPVAGAGLAIAGTGAKMLGPKMTQGALEKAAAAIRAGTLNKQTFMQQLAPETRTLLNSMLNMGASSVPARLGAP